MASSRLYRALCVAAGLATLLALVLWGAHNTAAVQELQEMGKTAMAKINSGQPFASSSSREAWRPHEHRIPPKMWQIMLPKDPAGTNTTFDPKALGLTASWIAKNPDYE